VVSVAHSCIKHINIHLGPKENGRLLYEMWFLSGIGIVWFFAAQARKRQMVRRILFVPQEITLNPKSQRIKINRWHVPRLFEAPHKCMSGNEVFCYCRLESGIITGLDCPVPPRDSPPFVSFCKRLFSEDCIPYDPFYSNCPTYFLSYMVFLNTLSKSWRFFPEI